MAQPFLPFLEPQRRRRDLADLREHDRLHTPGFRQRLGSLAAAAQRAGVDRQQMWQLLQFRSSPDGLLLACFIKPRIDRVPVSRCWLRMPHQIKRRQNYPHPIKQLANDPSSASMPMRERGTNGLLDCSVPIRVKWELGLLTSKSGNILLFSRPLSQARVPSSGRCGTPSSSLHTRRTSALRRCRPMA